MTLLKIDKSTHKANIRKFVEFWSNLENQDEKQGTQKFWMQLLRDVLCEDRPDEIIDFERPVKLGHTSYIDAYIKPTKVLIEQKSGSKSLLEAAAQSDGTLLTPFGQAKRYADELPYSEKPRFVVTSNFASFFIYDMEKPKDEPQTILLKDLAKDYVRLQFLVQHEEKVMDKELEVSIKAGALVGEIYDAFHREFEKIRGGEPTEADLHSLNVLCVRLVFCLYAEDAGIFGKDQFCRYMQSFRPENMRLALKDLFKVLDTPDAERDPFLEEKLKAFPYVNGSLFKEGAGEVIPTITEFTADVILNKASLGFDWSDISPTIFGAVFESTLNPETRRSGGMHYTSIENIHKVIDPLFMDDLRAEFEEIKSINVEKTRNGRLKEFQQKMGELTFFDPACGSGNFLTETYISMRTLENEALKLRHKQGPVLDVYDDSIYVNIHQFYGIEINDFAATVAKTALWIAESQMIEKTSEILQRNLDFLPLKSYGNITVGNALQMDWNGLSGENSCFDYIMGNPPFVGYSLQSEEQKADVLRVYVDEKGKSYKTAGKIDFVAAWYFKASQYMSVFPKTKTALVSTNSVTQGEQVAAIWKPLYDRFNIQIDFAYRTFRWDSESNSKAHVHCVIIGFSSQNDCGGASSLCHPERNAGEVEGSSKPKRIFNSDGTVTQAKNINAYLVDGENIFVESISKPLCDIPDMQKGSIPVDDGNLIIEAEDYESFVSKNPKSKDVIKPFIGATEFLHNEKRWCLWLKDVSPKQLKEMPLVVDRIKKVREFRLKSTKKATQKFAEQPSIFMEIRQPETAYIVVPSHSSENRLYIPLGFMEKDVICGNANLMIPSATLFHFGVLTSSVHMAWMRAVCGRLEMRYRYSKDVVYNNFPWPKIDERTASGLQTKDERERIEKTAQAILDVRALNQDCSLADLYDETTMPVELRKAHQANDKAVMDAYGFAHDMPESEIVARLLELYQALAEKTDKSKK